MKNDREIKELVELMHERELADIPSRDELEKEYTLSEDFYNNMDALIANRNERNRKRRFVAAKIAAIAACFIMVFAGSTRKIQHIQANDEVKLEWKDEALFFYFNTEENCTIPEYELGYVPEGSVCKDKYSSEYVGFTVYDTGYMFYYSVSGGNMAVNNNSCVLKLVMMDDGNTVYYLESYNEKYPSSFVWLTNEGKYIFVLSGHCGYDELKKGYDSVRPVVEK